MSDLSPQSFGRGGWGVVNGAGQLVAGPYACEYTAIGAAERLERQARERIRACISCSSPMKSSHAGHRMCQPCRARARSIA